MHPLLRFLLGRLWVSRYSMRESVPRDFSVQGSLRLARQAVKLKKFHTTRFSGDLLFGFGYQGSDFDPADVALSTEGSAHKSLRLELHLF